MNKLTQFLSIGLKTLKRERFFALINILGLGLGIFCFMLTAMYVKDELTFDRWHANADNIYIPQQKLQVDNGYMTLMPSYAIGNAWVEEAAGVKDVVNISNSQTKQFEIDGTEFETKSFYQTTDALFRIFDFKLRLGDEKTALSEPNTIILSDEMARKHFGNENPLGHIISISGDADYMVTGVLERIPSNSHLQFDMLAPIDFTKGEYKGLENNFQFGSGLHYILLEEGYDLDKLSEETQVILEKHTGDRHSIDFSFARFSEAYLEGWTYRNTGGMFSGQAKYIAIFSFIGSLMLLVASFNYINLTTSRALARAKDFAIRKVIGAGKWRIVSFQLSETLFVGFLAMVLAIIALEISLPGINTVIGKKLSLNIVDDPSLLFIPSLTLLFVVIVSGVYPAVVGSKISISSVLKGNTPNSSGATIRKVLIVLQFIICSGVLASGLIIRSQANYMVNKDMGYNAENVMNISLYRGGMSEKYEAFKAELLRSPLIENAMAAPVPRSSGGLFIDVGEGENNRRQFVSNGNGDIGFVEMFDLEIVAGKSFANVDQSQLANGVLVNEALIEDFGLLPEEAIGSKIDGTNYTILGVLKDFHISATKNKIMPLLVMHNLEQMTNMNIKFRNGNKQEVVAYVEKVWKDLGATDTFEFKLAEDYYAESFDNENTLVSIFNVLTLMLVVVAGLGLFALTVFESQLKEKELCIRKVLGANYLALLKRLNTGFLALIGLSILISIPLTQYLIGSWLNAFPYRIESTMIIYIVTASIILLLALLMLTAQGIKAVKKNPVDILRNE